MKLLRFFGGFLLVIAVPLCAEFDVSSIKKAVDADLANISKIAAENAHKAADEFRIRDAQAEIIVKTYGRDQHEAFRSAEEMRLVDRVTSNAQRLVTDVDAMVESAFVDILKRQNDCDALNKKDIAVFKQQFSENIIKMMQGKSPTPITYSSSEALAKPAAAIAKSGLNISRAQSETVMHLGEDVVVPAAQKKSQLKDIPSEPLKSIANYGSAIDDSKIKNVVASKKNVEATPAKVDKVVTNGFLKSAVTAPSVASVQPNANQADLLRQIRGGASS